MKHRKVLLVLAAFAAATLSLVTAAEAAPATPPAPTPAHTRHGGVVVEDITFTVPGQFNTVHAWLVRPGP